MKTLILASTSPRRKAILTQVGYAFTAVESGFVEVIDQSTEPHELVRQLSQGKARAVIQQYPESVILGADTVTVMNNEIIGKPKDQEDAARILTMFSGASHKVITGFTIIDCASGTIVTKTEETTVYFRTLGKSEIASYIKSGEPMDKAGAYGAQDKGALFIERIVGDFYNVVGLPICAISTELKNFGISAIISV